MALNVDPELIAKSLLKELNVKSPEDLLDLEVLAYYRGALVRYTRLNGSEARLSVVGSKAVISISDEVMNLHRRRFSIAHELGHLEMHRYDTGIAICTGRDLNEWTKNGRTIEHEANLFASALLLPASFFSPLCNQHDPSLDLVSQLGQRFQVSLTATALRYIQFSQEPLTVVYSQAGRVRWVSSNSAFQELSIYVENNVRLDPLSSASRVATQQVNQSPRKVPASAWFARGRYDEDSKIVEHSWYIASLDAILTLLWVDGDITDDEFFWR